jgi:hypothetical protein
MSSEKEMESSCQLQTETYYRWCHTNADNSNEDWKDCERTAWPLPAGCEKSKEDAKNGFGIFFIMLVIWLVLTVVLTGLQCALYCTMKSLPWAVISAPNSIVIAAPTTIPASVVAVQAFPVAIPAQQLDKELTR